MPAAFRYHSHAEPKALMFVCVMKKVVWFALFVVVALGFSGCGKSRDQAIQELARLNLKFSTDDFVRSAENGDLRAFQLFLEAGIDVNLTNSNGATALMAAAQKGRIEIVTQLIAQKANLDLQGRDGATALWIAAESNQLDIVKALLKANADPNIQDHTGWSALMRAVYQGNSKCVEAIAGKSRQEVNRGLLIAAATGHTDVAKVLLDYGAEVDSRAEDGSTALMIAASKGNADLVALLLKAGADPGLADKSGSTAPAIADAKGFRDLATALHQAPLPAGKSSASPNAGELTSSMSDADVLAATDPNRAANRKPEQGSTEPNPNDAASDNIKKVAVTEINQDFLPIMLTEINGRRAKIQGNDNEIYTVAVGDQLKGLDYKVSDLVIRNTEDKDGNPVDASVMKLKNTKTGDTISVIRGVPAQEHGSYATLSFPNSEEKLKVQTEQEFSIPNDPDHTYTILDIRPTQVVVRRVQDNRVFTLQKSK
jgi:ankyrin repeat protein